MDPAHGWAVALAVIWCQMAGAATGVPGAWFLAWGCHQHGSMNPLGTSMFSDPPQFGPGNCWLHLQLPKWRAASGLELEEGGHPQLRACFSCGWVQAFALVAAHSCTWKLSVVWAALDMAGSWWGWGCVKAENAKAAGGWTQAMVQGAN